MEAEWELPIRLPQQFRQTVIGTVPIQEAAPEVFTGEPCAILDIEYPQVPTGEKIESLVPGEENGYYNLFTSIQEACREENMKRMPKDLPVLFVSGAEDPVGNFGKGVEQARKAFQAAGMEDVTWILYENDRHEILNETDRDTVYRDLYAWLYVRLADPRRKTGGN